ncbi:GNAT family N-acetyltransferase [Lutispora thermophila]|uniref:Acetyltransferase (GNAT) domain-containing protein n=1 Tax=Lutispora thermophila DSM 19022 TaxID=1122184 RepID=A0A1M6CYH1_9FIRM|nr:GNAT family N-acetyltransferase [Lutispora thermophila]SHI66036.1 Acetyltransferase (GNAT) domain-containing protein [Lutispora thermophila DSM 19022]
MLKLIDINEKNWLDARKLSVDSDQQVFLDTPTGIMARGYVYRFSNANVIGISNDNQIIGIALVKDLNEEPACYDLQQFMIDRRFQNKGFGTEALRLIISRLQNEGKFNCVEACVSKSNAPALHVLKKIGFKDTGYIDDDLPNCLNLIYHFEKIGNDIGCYSDVLISDFLDPMFQNAFKLYFSELDFTVDDWDQIFKEMNDEGGNLAFVRRDENEEIIGFIQFKPIVFTSCFFEETYGFIREFWVAQKYRNKRHGSELLELAEKYFYDQGIYSTILTTDTAERFYLKHGYVKVPGCKAKNEYDVYVKRLK